MKKYDIKVWEACQTKDVIIFRWAAKGIGFGELVIDNKTHEILDDEYMGIEFVNEVIRVGFEEFGRFLCLK